MKNFLTSAKIYITGHKIISGVALVLVLFGSYYVYKGSKPAGPTQYVLATVTRDTVISSISGSGSISAEDEIDLKPQGSGQVTEVDAVAGQSVSVGQTIAVLDERNALASIAQAKANLESVQANYDSTMAGETGENLALDQAALTASQSSLTNTEQNLLTKISQVYTTVDTDITNKTYPLFSNPTSAGAQLDIPGVAFNDAVLLAQVDTQLPQVENMLAAWKTEINGFNSSTDSVAAANDAITNLKQMDVFFSNLATLFNTDALVINSSAGSSVTSDTINSGNINSDKTTASGAQNDVESNITSLQSAIQGVQSAVASLAQAQATYNLKIAPPTASVAASAEAQLLSAKASLQSAYDSYDNNIITSPISGTLAEVDLHIGDQASSGTTAAVVVTTNQVAVIPLNEVDVANVKVGQKATLTFDALPDLTLTGKVAQVDPIGVVTQGVVNYNVTIALDTQSDQVKPNMSVDVSIITAVSQDALVVPSEAIQTLNGTSYVQVANGVSTSTPANPSAAGAVIITAGTPVSTQVVTGLSNDTETEIVSGLNEGDTIVDRTVAGTTATAKTTTTSGLSLLGGGGAGAARGGFTGGAAGRTTTTR